MISTTFLPPELMIGNPKTPAERARRLAEVHTDQATCPFFSKFYAGADDEYVQTQLCKAVVLAVIHDMHDFEQELKAEMIRTESQYLGSPGKESYANHANRVLCALQDLFIGRPDIENRVADALEAHHSQDVFDQMGMYYSVFWYGITGKTANSSTVYVLNCLHDEIINNMTEHLQDEFARNRKRNNWLFFLIILAFCLVAVVIILSCS